MPRGRFSPILVLLFAFGLQAAGSSTQVSVSSMKLLTPESGWAVSGDRLFWTSNAGSEWKDITPAKSAPRYISDVFFLNTSVGWVLRTYGDPDADEPEFELAATANAGRDWSISTIRIPHLDSKSIILSGQGWIDFVDSSHGWLILRRVSSAAFSLGISFVTDDGGKTWKTLPDLPVAEPFRFVTSNDAWMSRRDASELYVTRDGARSWHKLVLKAPAEAGAAIYPTYDLPIFQDSKQGFLPVTFSGGNDVLSALVLFVTNDGGATWKSNRVLAGLRETSVGEHLPCTVADSVLLCGEVSDKTVLTLTAVTPGGKKTSVSVKAAPALSAVSDLSFISSKLRVGVGWGASAGDSGWWDVVGGCDAFGECNRGRGAVGSVFTGSTATDRSVRPTLGATFADPYLLTLTC